MSRLQDKVALITGAGSGMGKAMAERFAAEGAHVIVTDVIEERVTSTVEGIKAKGHSARGVVVDVSNEEQVAHMVQEVLSQEGRIDVLCNNAGIMDGMQPLGETSDELLHRVLGVNLFGPIYLTRAVLPSMLERGGGSIVNTASVAGLFGGRAGAAYTISKHGLVGLTRSVAAEYWDQGIRCNAICPGAVATAIGMGSATPNLKVTEMVQKLSAAHGKIGQPEEIANLALFLASDEASFINGAIIVADGGWTVL